MQFQKERRKSRADRLLKKLMAKNFANFGKIQMYTP